MSGGGRHVCSQARCSNLSDRIIDPTQELENKETERSVVLVTVNITLLWHSLCGASRLPVRLAPASAPF